MRINIAKYLPKTFRLNATRKYLEFKDGWEFSEWGVFVPKHMNIMAVLTTPEGKFFNVGHNLVTAAGDAYYAARGAAATPGTIYGSHAMATAHTGVPTKTGAASQYGNVTVVSGSLKATDATYPLISDADTDNTGGGATVVTWRVSYTKADFNTATAITDGVITIANGNPNTVGSPVSGSNNLTGYVFASSFTKSVDDTLKVFVNHTLLGV
jgi:hypothetical protein